MKQKYIILFFCILIYFMYRNNQIHIVEGQCSNNNLTPCPTCVNGTPINYNQCPTSIYTGNSTDNPGHDLLGDTGICKRDECDNDYTSTRIHIHQPNSDPNLWSDLQASTFLSTDDDMFLKYNSYFEDSLGPPDYNAYNCLADCNCKDIVDNVAVDTGECDFNSSVCSSDGCHYGRTYNSTTETCDENTFVNPVSNCGIDHVIHPHNSSLGNNEKTVNYVQLDI